MIGMRKAKVFPLPVFASAITSLPANIIGMVADWMGVMWAKWNSFVTASDSEGFIGKLPHSRFRESTRASSIFLNIFIMCSILPPILELFRPYGCEYEIMFRRAMCFTHDSPCSHEIASVELHSLSRVFRPNSSVGLALDSLSLQIAPGTNSPLSRGGLTTPNSVAVLCDRLKF